MKDINYPLRKKYVATLAAMVVNTISVPVYYLSAPQTETSPAYITLNSPANVDAGTKYSSDTNTSMQVQIHTWADGNNAGKLADDIAGEVFNRIYPTSNFILDLEADGFQMINTELAGDSVESLSDSGNREFVTRILTFRHNIYHQ